MKILIVSLLILASAAASQAQGLKDLAPGPLIQPQVPADGCWSATYTYTGKSGAKEEASYKAAMKKMAAGDPVLAEKLKSKPDILVRQPRLQKREVSKSGEIRLETSIYITGQRGERWRYRNSVVYRDAFTQKLSVDVSESAEKKSDFPEFGWISETNFTGVKTVRGKKCLVFSDKINPLQIENPGFFAQTNRRENPQEVAPATVTAVATIDLETRLPISLTHGNETQNYEMQKAAPLELPADVALQIREAEERAKARTAPSSAP